MRSCRTDVLIGGPAPKLVRGKPEGVDSMLMGTRDMGALGDLALCSTATKAIHLADVPVLSRSDTARRTSGCANALPAAVAGVEQMGANALNP